MKFSTPKPPGALGDDDPMPFGKHKGVPMKFVPPGYLEWLGEQEWIKSPTLGRWPGVRLHIEWRRAALEGEMKRAERERSR